MKMHSYTLVNRDLRREFLKDPKNSSYPQNLTFYSFYYFLIAPALVYQVNYPRTSNFRLGYFILKLLLLTVELVCLYLLITENILPTSIKAKDLSFIDVYVRLITPCLVAFNLFFLIIFEQILNLFGEISRFGDREFYQDWWNSDGFADFSRKWNRPVHYFLHQHVYLETINEFKWNPSTAKYVTFLFSSLCHEFILALIVRRISPYLLVLMMLQIPLIIFNKMVKINEFGLYLFWVGIITGPPLLFTFYAKASSFS